MFPFFSLLTKFIVKKVQFYVKKNERFILRQYGQISTYILRFLVDSISLKIL